MRGLDTAFPFFRPGLSRSEVGRRSMIGHTVSSGVPLPWSRPHPYTIDACGLSPLVLTATEGAVGPLERLTIRAVHSPGDVTPFEVGGPRD